MRTGSVAFALQGRWWRRVADARINVSGLTLFAIVVAALLAQTPGRAQQTAASLPYARGFLLTGDYVVGDVDLREGTHPIVNGFSTAAIPMRDVPDDADIVAAYLFWETTTLGGEAWKTQAAGVRFRGFDIDVTSGMVVRGTSTPGDGASCFGSGSVLMHMFMADVLRFLPIRLDKNNNPTGKRLVNDDDLIAHSAGLHTVTLPVRDGNSIPESPGATLVVVYNNPSASAPLKKVVIYQGNNRKPSLDLALTQTIQGFYGSAQTGRSAKLTHIVASGQPNNNLKFGFTAGAPGSPETVIGDSPFTSGPASQRWWASPTYDVTPLMQPGTNSGAYGETVSTRIFHSPPTGGDDCVASGAVIFSTSVQDGDNDGLPDALEDSASVLKDPPPADSTPLPNLKAMGAGSDAPDMFVEVNAMWARGADATATPPFPGTTYGSLEAPYFTKTVTSCVTGDVQGTTKCTTSTKHTFPAGQNAAIIAGNSNAALNGQQTLTVIDDTTFSLPVESAGGSGGTVFLIADAIKTDALGHHHMPTPDVLGKIGDAFDARGIRVHFDVGDIAAYRALGVVSHKDWTDDYTAPTSAIDPNKYLVPSQYADGGELIEEKACDASDPACQFPDYPGTVSWPVGLQYLRDLPVADNGAELTPADEADWVSSQGRRRFDPKRMDYVHYLLYGHGRAKPRSQPCLIDGVPAPYDSGDPIGTACTTPNPDFNPLRYHVPSTSSGVANLPGRNALITLGLWDELVGRPFQVLGTTFHEIGHMVGLWHGGKPAQWGDKAKNTATFIEPNCKPNYISSMSYNFQIHGLFDDTDQIYVDFSGIEQEPQSDLTLSDHSLLLSMGGFRSYRPAWFAPIGSALVNELGVSAAPRYCNGAALLPGVQMARVQADLAGESIDWNGNKSIDSANFGDANFDGIANADLAGYNDWANIRLNQIGATPYGLLPGSAEGLFGQTWEGVFAQTWEGLFGQTWEGLFGQTWEGVFAQTWEGVFGQTWEGLFGQTWEGVFGQTWEGLFGQTWEGVFGQTWEGVFAQTWEGVFAGTAEGQEDLTFEDARAMGKGRPYKVKTCVFERDERFDPFDSTTEVAIPCTSDDATRHNALVTFQPLQVGGIAAYEIQRKSDAADPGTPDSSFATAEPPLASHLFTFTDHANLANNVVYSYRVRGLADDGGDNGGWSRSIDVLAVNDAPEANDDGPFEVATGSSLTIQVSTLLANDTDDDSLASAIALKEIAAQPAHGTAVINANGSITYTPDPTYAGSYPFTDTFTYVADNGAWSGDKDGLGVTRMSDPSNPAIVSIIVTNAAPVCNDITASVVASTSTLLAHNCTDPNGDALTVDSVGPVPAGGGTAAVTNPLSGSFNYTAPPTTTTVTFPYRVRDGKGGVATANARITVTQIPPYGFKNIQNLPATKSAKTGSVIPLRWQWLDPSTSQPVNTAGQATVRAYSCAAGTVLGPFTPALPGSGNSFSYDATTFTWSFNWKLVSPSGANLPVGDYVIQVGNTFTGQVNPVTVQCGGFKGALLKITK
jgi:hypothetical protein